MCGKNCKRVVVSLGLLGLGVALWSGSAVRSYVQTGYKQVAAYFQGQVPIEFELQRAKQLLAELNPTIQKSLRTIAEEEVEVAKLQREIDRTVANLDKEKDGILVLRGKLDQNLASYTVGERKYTSTEMRSELNRRFASYKQVDATLLARRGLLSSRHEALDAARLKYDGLILSKTELEGELAKLEARFKLIEAEKTARRIDIDDSELTNVRRLVDSLNDRIAVDAKVLEKEGELVKQIPLEQPAPRDVGQQIDSYFGKDAKTVDASIKL
ncbi:MAG: hypothetical protein ACRC1K_05225 [Planctomycetia bacterium]